MTETQIFNIQKEHYLEVGNTTVLERIKKLKKLEKSFKNHRNAIKEALYKDHKKTAEEVDIVDILPVLHEFKEAINNLHHWAAPEVVATPLLLIGSSSQIIKESKGLVLIISPWNFPFNLTFNPLISAIAGGNCVIIKPSEFTPHASALIQKIIEDVFESKEITVLVGGVEVSKELLKLPFHHIFFTGSSNVGKIVMKAAAENLTSVTLELGGKSPSIVDQSAHLKTAARRLVMIKLLVNGQICIAPDYVLVHESVAQAFANEVLNAMNSFFGADAKLSESYSRIINKKQHTRLLDLIADAKSKGDEIISDVKSDENQYLSPTVILSNSDESLMMQEEIFGPVLPLKTYSNLDDAISFIQEKPRPLALYIFSTTKKNIAKIVKNTRAGATVINSAGIHHFNTKLPFGGVNNSGIGKSHSKFGYLEMVNLRPILKTHSKLSTLEVLMPPYTGKFKKWVINFMVKYL